MLTTTAQDRPVRFDVAVDGTGDEFRDPSQSWRALIERFGSDFLDEIRAAEGADLLLLSEDHVLRALGHLEYIVSSTWLQPVLMRALKLNAISEEAYRDAIVAMIDSKFQFIAISPDILLSAVRDVTGHTLPITFEKLVRGHFIKFN